MNVKNHNSNYNLNYFMYISLRDESNSLSSQYLTCPDISIQHLYTGSFKNDSFIFQNILTLYLTNEQNKQTETENITNTEI